MVNWEDIHPDFTEELQKEWEDKDFNYTECKKWAKALEEVFDIKNYNFVAWLRDDKESTAETLNYDELDKLIKEYNNQTESETESEITSEEEEILEEELCPECQQPTAHYRWCRVCNSSGNPKIDEFIWESRLGDDKLGWIPYENFSEIEYMTDGGFSKIYKANLNDKEDKYWKWMGNEEKVVLKVLNDSKNMTVDFLQEVTYHTYDGIPSDYDSNVMKCHAISQDPKTKDYIMVMNYIEEGNLRQYLRNNYQELDFVSKMAKLYRVIDGLKSIHKQGLVHCDFHSGNILGGSGGSYNGIKGFTITDLGLCRPINEKDKNDKIYGVLPYVAPEVLNGKSYTQASDIYSLGIIAWEILSNLPPYYNVAHDNYLWLKINDGLRPKFNVKIPKLLEDLIKQCWDKDPSKRPTASQLEESLRDWKGNKSDNRENSEFYRQYKEIEEEYNRISKNTKYEECKIHLEAVYTSRLLSNLMKSQEISNSYVTKELDLDIKTPISTNEISKRFRSLSMEEVNRKEAKSVKLDKIEEERKLYSEPTEIEDNKQELRQEDFKKSLRGVYLKSIEYQTYQQQIEQPSK